MGHVLPAFVLPGVRAVRVSSPRLELAILDSSLKSGYGRSSSLPVAMATSRQLDRLFLLFSCF